MKKKNMEILCNDISKIKQAMVDRYSIVDDYDTLYNLLKKKKDLQIKQKDICKLVSTILNQIENDVFFTKEIENQIVENVKKLLNVNKLNIHNMLSILYNNNVLIDTNSEIEIDGDFLSLKRNIVHGFEKDETGNIYHNSIVIPCTTNFNKLLFIDFKLLTDKELEHFLSDITDFEVDIITNFDIEITNIYIK